MAWLTKPSKCIHCKNALDLDFRQVEVDGKKCEGWVCGACGWFHLFDKAYADTLKAIGPSFTKEQAAEAIQARKQGVWDNKQLRRLGALMPDAQKDIERIERLTR
jgi:glutaredoxin